MYISQNPSSLCSRALSLSLSLSLIKVQAQKPTLKLNPKTHTKPNKPVPYIQIIKVYLKQMVANRNNQSISKTNYREFEAN